MDDQYREGFERLLSDMDEAPPWEQISTRHAAPTPVPSRGRGLLVAAAAFVVTVVAVGAVVFAVGGGTESAAPVAPATVDHIRIRWNQEAELACVEMRTRDNGGFETATVDIWGPNVDGLVRIDATAPDGTVERVVTNQSIDRTSGWQVWSSYDGRSSEKETAFRVGACVEETAGGSSEYSMTDTPVDGRGHAFDAFISLPAVLVDGVSIEEALGRDAMVRDEVWRGIPVKVYTRDTAHVDDQMGASASVIEVWYDPAARRWERMSSASHQETLGTVVTTIEVIERDTVPAESVSFSTEGLTLTLDLPPVEPSNDEVQVTTTTLPPLETVDVAVIDDLESLDEEVDRLHALIDAAAQQREEAVQEIERNQEILDALEAQTDPPTSQQVIERQRVILRVAELKMRRLEEIIAHNQESVAGLEIRRAELVKRIEAEAEAMRAAAVALAARHAPYSVVEPVELTPPPPLSGTDGASGSGCYPGPGDLPDGIWFGYLLSREGLLIDFDVACMYYGELAWEMAAEAGDEANGDVWFVDDVAISRTLPVAESAIVWAITGDATEGHQVLSYTSEWTGAESTYTACPGEDCRVWIYVNGGNVDAIVEQYTP